MTNENTTTRRLRLERLVGTDDTKGARGDLARALALRAYTAAHPDVATPHGVKALAECDATVARAKLALETYARALAEVCS